MDAQNDNRNHETTNPVAKSGMQRTSTYLLLYGFGLSTNLCMGLHPSIFSFLVPNAASRSCAPLHRTVGASEAGSVRAVSEKIRDTDRMNKGVHPRKERLDFSAHGSRQRRRDSAGQKEPTGGPDRSHVRLLGRGDDVEVERCARLRSKDTWTCAEGGAGPALRC